MTPYDFLREHAIKNNQKPTTTPPSTIIDAVENHSFPPFAYLELFPSTPPPPDNQWDCYLSFLEEPVISLEREHNVNSSVDIPFALGWHVIRTGAHTEEGGGGAGYWVIIWLGPSLTVPKFSTLRRSLRRITSRRKKGRGTREMKRRARDHSM